MQLLKNLFNLTYYTSELDDFLANFDKNHPKLSTSQRKEIEKYTRIFNLRDKPNQTELTQEFWDNF